MKHIPAKIKIQKEKKKKKGKSVPETKVIEIVKY